MPLFGGDLDAIFDVSRAPYSASGDDADWDTAAIDQAVRDAAGGGIVLFPPLGAGKPYLRNKTFNLPSGSSLLGMGAASAIKFTYALSAAQQATYIQNVDQTSGAATVGDFLLENLKLIGANDAVNNPGGVDGGPWGTSAANNQAQGALFRRCSRARAHKVWFDRFPGIALLFQGGTDHDVDGCLFTRCGRGGVDFRWYTPGTDGFAEYERISLRGGCKFFQMGDDAIAVNSDISVGAGLRSAIPVALATTVGSPTVVAASAPARPFAVGDVVTIPGAAEYNQVFEAVVAAVDVDQVTVTLDDAPAVAIPSATLTVTGASNETPIRLTIVGHGLPTGHQLTVANVGGNTAANGSWSIRVLDADHVALIDSAGNGAYTGGGTATPTSWYGVIRPRLITLDNFVIRGYDQAYPGDAQSAGVAFGRGVYIRGCEQLAVTNFSIVRPDYAGIEIVSEHRLDSSYGSGIRSTGITVANGSIKRAGEFGTQATQPPDGIHIEGAGVVTLTDLVIDRAKRYGIYASDIDDLIFGRDVSVKRCGAGAADYGVFVNGNDGRAPIYSVGAVNLGGLTAKRNKGGGIRVAFAQSLTIADGVQAIDNGAASTAGAATQSGVIVDGGIYALVLGLLATDRRASAQKTQAWGLRADDSSVLTVTGATNASPIVISVATAPSRPFLTGETVTVLAVGGNTAANTTTTITRISDTSFSLDGTTGNGAYTSGGRVRRADWVQPELHIVDAILVGNKNSDPGYVIAPANITWSLSGGHVATTNANNSKRHISTLLELWGSATPEGAVTAPVGSVYHRVDGGAATSLYVKETGTGNTGWVGK